MLNQTVLVGKLVVKRYGSFDLEVDRNYKEVDGSYSSDTLTVYYKPNSCISGVIEVDMDLGDLVGVKGRLETYNGSIIIMCEKLSHLTTGK